MSALMTPLDTHTISIERPAAFCGFTQRRK
jgi:hypothetical protein